LFIAYVCPKEKESIRRAIGTDMEMAAVEADASYAAGLIPTLSICGLI